MAEEGRVTAFETLRVLAGVPDLTGGVQPDNPLGYFSGGAS